MVTSVSLIAPGLQVADRTRSRWNCLVEVSVKGPLALGDRGEIQDAVVGDEGAEL